MKRRRNRISRRRNHSWIMMVGIFLLGIIITGGVVATNLRFLNLPGS